MAAFVKSIQKHTITLGAGVGSNTSPTLDPAVTTANCVPFITTRVTTANGAAHGGYAVDADFSDSTHVRVATGLSATRVLEVEVTVVEFDPTYVKVQQPTFSTTGTQPTFTEGVDFDGGTGFKDATFLYHTWQVDDTATSYDDFHLRGNIFSDTTMGVSRFGSAGTISGHCYLVEALSGDFTVEHVEYNTGSTLVNASITTVDDTAKTLLLGSFKNDYAGLANDAGTINVKLNTASQVQMTRSGSSGNVWGVVQVIEFPGNENVYRGVVSPTDGDDTVAIGTTVVEADSMARPAGVTGSFTSGSFAGIVAADCPDAHCSMSFPTATQVQIEHDTGGDVATLAWEVIEWDVQAAASPTRRVMVIS